MKISTSYKSVGELTHSEMAEELQIYRSINYIYLLELLGRGILWIIMNWPTVKAEADKIRRRVAA